jgi:signal transduction histidine kinase
VAAVASWWPFWASKAGIGTVNLLVAVSFAATAAVLYEDPEQHNSARAIALAAAFYLTSWWWAWPAEWQWGPLPLVSFLFGYLWFMFGGMALLRYPDPRLVLRYERIFFVALTSWIAGLKLLLALVSRPEWAGFSPRAWWPALFPDHGLFGVVTAVFNSGLVVFTLGLLGLLLLKIRRVRGLELLDAAPAVVAAGVVAVCGGIYLTARVIELSVEVQDTLRIVTAVAALVTPLAFLTAVLRRQFARTAVADFVPRVARSLTAGDVQDELQRTLQDPTLRLWCWRSEQRDYIDASGNTSRPAADADRWLVTIQSGEGELLAATDMRGSLRRHRSLVESVLDAAGLALENQAKLDEVLASRARLNEAELTARYRIGRDLHDGAQQILMAAKTKLAIARMRASADDGARAAIDEARVDLNSAVEEIRDLARGHYPTLLRNEGLTAALMDRVEHLDFSVKLQVTEKRFRPTIEENLYFVVSEALTNVVRHAEATTAAVTIALADDEIVVEIGDDGRGGAAAGRGSGLSGMADRVHLLGGRFQLDSAPGRGTNISARIPCA